MSVLYVTGGAYHFIHPEVYRKIMPHWLPWHEELIFISGVGEILFALFLLLPQTRQLGAWGIIALLIAVFPANIQMTLNYFHHNNPRLWLSIVRLPLQFLLIWWAYSITSLDNNNNQQPHKGSVK